MTRNLQLKLNEYWIPIFIFLVALFLRLWHYSDFSLSNDELSALSRIYPESVLKTIELGVRPDGHPAGVQIFLHYIVVVFGNTASIIRLPFVLFGSFSVLLIYILAKRWFGEASAILSAAALCFLEFPILYSQIARPYSSGLFLAILLSLSFDDLVFRSALKKQNIFKALYFGFILALNLYNHYFSGLFALIASLTGFVFIKKNNIINYLVGLAFASLLFLPHLEITFSIAKNVGGVGEWLAKPNDLWIVDHFIYIFNNSIFLSITVLLTFIVSAVLFKNDASKNKFKILSLFWFLSPFLIGYIYSVKVNPILQNSVLLFTMPFLLLFLFSFFNSNKLKKEYVFLLAFVVFGLSFINTNYYSKSHFDDFKNSAIQIEIWKKESASNTLFIENINNPWYLEYYLTDSIQFKIHNTKTIDDLIKLKYLLNTDSSAQCIYLKTGVSSDIAKEMIQAHFPNLKKMINYGDFSALYCFDKNKKAKESNQIVDINTIHFSELNSKDSNELTISKEYFLEYNWQSTSDCDINYYIEFEFSSTAEQSNALFVLRKLDKNKKELMWLGIPFNFFEFSKGNGKFVANRTFITMKKGEVIHSFIWNKYKENLTINKVNLVLRRLKDE